MIEMKIKGLLIKPGEEPKDYFASPYLDDITIEALKLDLDDDFVDITPLVDGIIMAHFVTEDGVKPNRLPSAITGEPFVRTLYGNIFICRKASFSFSSLEPGDKDLILANLTLITQDEIERYKGGEGYGEARAD